MLQKLSFVLLCLLLAVPVHRVSAQDWGRLDTTTCTGVISGRVVDAATGEQLEQATVAVLSGERIVAGRYSTAQGFRLEGLCPGTYVVKVSYISMEPWLAEVRVRANKPVVLTARLLANSGNEVDIIGYQTGQRALASQSISRLSSVEIARSRGLSLGDALRQVPGVYALQTGPTLYKPVIRGLTGNRVLVMANGVRLEGQQWGNEHAPEVDPSLATDIRIVKGASSVLYGSDAIGGVVLLDPPSLLDVQKLGGEVQLGTYTNGGGVTAHLRLEDAIGKHWRWRVAGSGKYAGTVATPTYFLTNTGYREYNYHAGLGYRRDNWNLELSWNEYRARVGMFTGASVGNLADLTAATLRAEPLAQGSFSYNLDRPYQDVLHRTGRLKYYQKLGLARELTVSYSFQENQRSEYDFVSITRGGRPELYLSLQTHALDARMTYELNSLRYEVGTALQTQGNIREELFIIPNFRSYTAGAYGTVRKRLSAEWQVEAGLRYDWKWLQAYIRDPLTQAVLDPLDIWNNVTGTVGVKGELGDRWQVALNLGKAWRAPNVSELYARGTHQGAASFERGLRVRRADLYRLDASREVRTEDAYSATATASYEGRGVSLTVEPYINYITGFVYQQADSLVQNLRGAQLAFNYNQTDALLLGLELQMVVNLTPAFTATVKGSWIQARDVRSNEALPFLPPARLQTEARYSFKPAGRWSGLSLALTHVAVARQQDVPSRFDFANPPAGYGLLGLEAGGTVTIGRQPVELLLTLANGLNHTYREYLDRFRYFANAPGRNLMFRVRLPLAL